MRIPLRSLATVLMAVGVASCSDTQSKPTTGPNGNSVARVDFQPVFSQTAAATFAQLADFAIDFDHVHVTVIRPPSETVKDTLIAFRPGQASITLDLTVPVRVSGEVFKVTIDYVTTQSVVFHGEGTVAAHAPDQPAPPTQITIEYKGPGSNATRIVVAPKTVKLVAPGTQTFTVSAFDASNAVVTNVPINWTTSDASIATISAAGVLTTTGKRGTVTVTALTPTNLTDNASAAVTLPPTSITLVSGGGQTGKAGAALAQPAVVKVLASDGGGVADVTVNFAAPVGGKVGAATATTDANGQASTTLTLGGALGPQAFAAAAAGFSVAIPATATAGDAASIVVASGSGQADTVRRALKNPLVAKVTDQFSNPIPNVVVTWSRTGSGTLSATTSTTNSDGLATVSYTLGSTVGTETITATAAGITSSATFTVQVLPAAPATIVAVSGSGQSGRVGQALSAPFVVHVADDAGNSVSGATVSWTAVNGTLAATTTTDAQGNSSNTLTLGSAVGNASATATVNGKSVTFSATVQVGIVAKSAFRTQPTNGAVNQALTPAVQVELQDAGGNRTAASNAVTISLGANPGQATLTGTLTRQAVSGIATFDDLKISAIGTGYTLVALSAGTPNISSTPFNIGGTTATIIILQGNNQTAAVNTAVGTPPSVRLVDAQGGALDGVPVTFSTTNGNGTVVPTSPILTDCGGVAPATSWTLGQVAGPQTLIASAPGAASVTINATAVAGLATKMVILTQPSATATSGTPLAVQPVIQVQDQFNNPVPNLETSVTAVFSAGSERNNVVAPDNTGVARFTSLTLTGAATGPVTFSSPNLPSVNSVPVTVTVSATQNTMLIIDPTTGNTIADPIPPTIVAAGFAMPANTPVVKVVNSSGQPVSGVQVTVSVAGPVPGTGTFTTNAQGIIPWAGATAPTVVGTYTLTATASGLLGSPRSATVNVVPGPAAFHQWIQQIAANSTVTSGSTFPTTTLGLYDQYNNLATTSVATIGITLDQTQSTNPNAQLGGTTTAQTVNGVATFNALTVTLANGGSGYHLIARNLTNTQNPAAISGNPFGIGTPLPPAHITSQTPTIANIVGTAIQPANYPSFKVTDNAGNAVPGAQLTIGFQSSGVCVPANPSSTTITTGANGIATLTPAQVTFTSSAPGSCSVQADSPFDIGTAYSNIVFGSASANVKTWTGATDFVWSTPSNWLPSGVPAASDQVFVTGFVQNEPSLATSATVAGLTLEPSSNALMGLGGQVLTINGSLVATVSSGGVFNGGAGGAVVMNSSTAATISGLVFAPVTIGPTSCGSTSYTVNGLFSASTLTVNCPLDLAGQAVSVTGALTTAGSGSIRMTTGSPVLTVGGNATFSGSEVGLLTNGGVLFGGDLTLQSGSSFSMSGTQTMAFSGSGGHTVTLGGLVPAAFQNVIVASTEDLTIGSGTFTISGGFSQLGSMVVSIGSDITLANSGSGTVTIAGTTTLNGALHVVRGSSSFLGSMFVNGTLDISGPNANFLTGTNITGGGGMLVQTPCHISATGATVNVTGSPAFNGAASCGP